MLRPNDERLTFERWDRALGFLPASVRCWLHAHLPEHLQRQAWDALEERIEAARIEEMREIARAADMTHISRLVESELDRLGGDAA